MGIYLALAGIFALAALLTAVWRAASRRYAILDIPNRRSSHQIPTPSGAGIAIIAAFLPMPLVLYARGALPGELVAPLAGGGLVLGLVGLADDYRSVAPQWRLLAQLVVATIAVVAIGPPLELLPETALSVWRWSVIAFVVLGVVWHVNLFNFMDGIDGIAGSQAIFVTAGAAVLSWIVGEHELNYVLLGLAAACGGFLVWNWPPAKVFMGDTGSGFLGFVLAVLAVYSAARGTLPIWTWFILMAAFVVDATVTIARRLLRGEKVYQAHRSHAYQWWARRLDSHARVTIGVSLINVLWLFPLALASALYRERAFLIAIIATLPLVLLARGLGAGKRESSATHSHPGV